MKQFLTISILLVFLSCSSKSNKQIENPELGKEYLSENEEKVSQETLEATLDKLKQSYPNGTKVLRDAHPKHHACVKANFEVNKEINSNLKHGIFSTAKTYPAWIRFSNGAVNPQADKNGDIRGIAIKLMNVDGDKLLESEKKEKTQDFLLISHPVLPLGDPKEYLDLFKAAFKGSPLRYLVFSGNFAAISIIGKIRSLKVPSVFGIRYWSTTPYKLGEQAVKYSIKPCTSFTGELPSEPTDNYLREDMKKRLESNEVCLEFFVQPQTDAKRMPIEDPSIEWDETISPFIKIATIKIPAQKFDSEEQMNFCENLSYTPWHSLPEHRPLGGINRVRKLVYEGVSKFRHEKNGVPSKEPTK